MFQKLGINDSEARKEFVNEWKVYKEHPEMQYPEEMKKLDKTKE